MKKKRIYSDMARVKAMRDEDIDYSDSPPTTKEFWQDAELIMPPLGNKQSMTIRVDSDVLSYCRALGKGYQKRINAVLRLGMLGKLRTT